MKRFSLKNYLFNFVALLLVFSALGPVAPALAAGGALVTGTAMSCMHTEGSVQMAIQKQIWTDVIMEGFYPKDDFLMASVDMSELVDYNTINLAEAGVDPTVLIDNTSYPISAATRSDTALAITLKTLDTESTIVRNIEKKELSYNKMESIVRSHRNALRKGAIKLAAHYWAPSSDGTYTPVIAATGDLYAGYKRLKFADILTIRQKLVALDIDIAKMNIMLNPRHEADLLFENMTLYKEMLVAGKIWGIRYFVNSQTPRFNASTGAKVAFGASPAGTDTIVSTLWHSDEVMKADGSVEVFAKYNDPDQKGDVINFQKRFVALPIRTKALGAIYSALS
jgi:hypothetical protein